MLGESVLNSEIYIDDYNVPCWNRRKHNGVVNCHISCNEVLISNTSSPIKLQKKIKKFSTLKILFFKKYHLPTTLLKTHLKRVIQLDSTSTLNQKIPCSIPKARQGFGTQSCCMAPSDLQAKYQDM